MNADAMEKRYDRKQYPYWCYDQHFCLKPPLLLILALIYLCRGFLMPLAIFLTSFKGANSDMMIFVSGPEHAVLLLTAIPAVLVLYALIRRSPKANKLARWSWKHAKALIVAAVLLDAGVSVAFFDGPLGEMSDDSFRLMFWLLADAYVLAFVLLSKRVRDAFSDFPAAPEEK